MSAHVLDRELYGIGSRTRRLVGVSAAIHVLLLLVWSLIPRPESALEGVTEITWIEMEDPAPAAPPPAEEARTTAEEEPREALPAPRESERHFVREDPVAEQAPRPQDLAAVEDQLRDRLASLQAEARDSQTRIAALAAPAVPAPTPASLPGVERGTPRRSELSRGSVTTAPPVELARAVPAAAPAPSLSRLQERPVPPGPAIAATSADVQQILAGVTLSGPVSDRALVSYRAPDFPDWAKREGVEGSVRVYFEVLPDGRVKRNALVDKTSGFSDFDQNALVALLEWRFAPLEGGAVDEQWGSITLNYRLDN